jgi:hypothetical protein
MSKILEHLNKLSLPATIVIASVVLGGFYFATQLSKQISIEKQQQVELQAKNEAKSEADNAAASKEEQQTEADTTINSCITDAYSELQTLKDNLDRMYLNSCSISITTTGCDSAWVQKTEKEWFTKYQNEWVPQCKLGNRVFIHTEPYYP